MEYIGYQDQTHSSQNMFRTILKATSFPGSIFTVPENLETDNVLYSSTANIIFTLSLIHISEPTRQEAL